MEDKLEYIVDEINLKCNLLVKDNKFLIDGYKNRLIMRLVNIYKKYKVPFNKDIILVLFNENLMNILYDINNSNTDSYRKVFEGYSEIINKYLIEGYNKDKIKKATTLFINMINNKTHPLFNHMTMNFTEALMAKTQVYDIYALNTEIKNRIDEDTKDLIEEMNNSNRKFVSNMMKFIIENIFKK